MRIRTTMVPALAAALLSTMPPGTLRAQSKAAFIALPSGALASAIGANGATVLGSFRDGRGFYWMPTTGVIDIGGFSANDINRDGRTIVGEAIANRTFQAAIWQRAAEWRTLGSIAPNAQPCDGLLSTALGTNADGRVIVGLAWNGCSIARAFRWEESTGMVDLGSTVPGRSSRADGISGDGRMIVGWQDQADGFRRGARWVDGRQTLFAGPSEIVGQAHAANADGSIIVGQVCDPFDALAQSAWVWTPSAGVQCLPVPRFLPPAARLGAAVATSDDGRVIGGGQSFGLESEAVLWLDRAPVYLKDYLIEHGVTNAFAGWVNTGTITDVSRDGRIVVGFGAGPRDFQGYIVYLAPLGERP